MCTSSSGNIGILLCERSILGRNIISITRFARGIFLCLQLSRDYFAHLSNLSLVSSSSSSSSTLHQSRPPYRCPKSSQPVGGDALCPKQSHHSSPARPWDKSNYLFLHLWQTLRLLPSTYPSVHTSMVCARVSVCHLPCGPPPRACVFLPPCPIRRSDGSKSYLVFARTLGLIHVRHSFIVHSHKHQGLNHLAITEMWQLD